jgi:hypothetical protein
VNISFDRVYNNAVGLRKFYLYTGTRFLLNYNVNASVDDTKFGLPGIASTSLK